MDTTPLPDRLPRSDDAASRSAWEVERIEAARKSVAAGYFATSAEVKAWIDSLGSDQQLPAPYPKEPRTR